MSRRLAEATPFVENSIDSGGNRACHWAILFERLIMRVSLSRSLLFVAGIALISTVAAADEKKSDAKDPNRMVCEKQEVLGSRLQSKRVCMTAAEWATKKREERMAIDKSQMAKSGQPGN
jgi:hypothetical protein